MLPVDEVSELRILAYGFWRVALIAAAVLLGCGGRPDGSDRDETALGLALYEAAREESDAVVWTIEEDGEVRSVWLRGDPSGGRVLAAREGLVLPAAGGVWIWEERPFTLELCDCERWSAEEMQGPCPPAAEPYLGEVPVLVDLVSGRRIEIRPPPDGEGDEPLHADYDLEVRPIASVGPYLLSRWTEESLGCGAAHGSWSAGFEAIDLGSGEKVDLLTPEERENIRAEELESALELMREDRMVAVESPDDVELTAIEPGWIAGIGLFVRYQFTAGASLGASDGGWGSYSRSVSVPARDIPDSLRPWSALPPAARGVPLPSGDVRTAGVAAPAGGPEQLLALAGAFSVENPRAVSKSKAGSPAGGETGERPR